MIGYPNKQIDRQTTITTLYIFRYSETLDNEYIRRINQMSSWQFFIEFYTILRKFLAFNIKIKRIFYIVKL